MTTDFSYPHIQMYIAGQWCAGGDGQSAQVLNPATEEVIGQVPLATIADLDRAVEAAVAGFEVWRATPVAQRTAILRDAADRLSARSAQVARVMTTEQGKPLAEARGEVLRVADALRWDADDARRAYGRIIPSAPGTLLSVRREPIGPVAAFTPWNFPAGSPMRKIAAALSAGCSIVIKGSEETPGTVCELVRCFAEAGVPAGVLNLVFGEPAKVSAHLISSPATRLVAFTGSVPVGKLLASAAGAAMKPSIMELGGHAPVIVCEDADPVVAARRAAAAKFANAGQVCTSPSRFLVHESVYEEFTAAFVEAAGALVVGDGREDGVTMGPLANERRLVAMEELVADAAARGAKIRCGGERLDRPGYFFPPTVLTDVPADARIMSEEPFGPIAPIVPFTELDEALRVANSLPYGLAAYGFTRSSATAERLVRGFEAGILSINHCGGSVHEAPSGGVKSSGYGREGGPEGLDAYLVTKRVSHILED
ncbi:NAD-dependent succinate-semialdehyde dehydrogenase [Planomonospora venezuelensis]|uniref:Succinate-semialdehyde dehydrogenase/glutarate-semialdehyde dehydrogenase n=1 Tax=Planomonospora venezuelensis TaxID=1999 RepID=A0A841DJS3_PLAVE|nr:NAD-dependent succinate-semialdehyde dehydrogenase [Planomonospora venezuelensis]MBB5967376.1 succinate-semialdehyde dehydrogenase/glutarate-semialdehyde dehydrogenase [Planomonospora venezuelensis]GIN03144.1 NAD-dependent succinate-semialdehyde dehydrogenase [Planomonospora venezuelensis]